MNFEDRILRLRRVRTIFPNRDDAMAYVEDKRKSHYGEPIVVRYRGEKNEVYAILAVGSSEYSTKNPNNRYQYIDPGLMEKMLRTEIDGRETSDEKICSSVGLAADGTHKRSTGNYTSGRTIATIEEEIIALDSEIFETNGRISDEASNRQAGDTKIIEAVGLSENGEYKTIGYYYTTGATSVAESVKALDGKLHDVELAIGKPADAKTKSTVYGYINKLNSVVEGDITKVEQTLEFEDGEYVPYTSDKGTKYINNQNSIRDEIRALDFAIQRLTKIVEEIHADVEKLKK